MNHAPANQIFVFEEGRFNMTSGGRLLVRISSAVGWAFLVAGTFLALSSDLVWVRWVGIFLGLFLLDHIFHRGQGDVPVPELAHRERVNLAQALPPKILRVLERAYDRSRIKRTEVLLEVAVALLAFPEIKEGLTRLDVSPEEFLAKSEELLGRGTDVEIGETLTLLLQGAFVNALQNGHRFIGATDIFAAITDMPSEITKRLFAIFGIESGDMERALIFSTARGRHSSFLGRLPRVLSGFVSESDRRTRHRVVNRAWTSRPTPTLDNYGDDLTDAARAGRVGFMVGHGEQYRHLLDVVSRSTNSNAILVGDPGTGKEGMVAYLALNVIKDRVPGPLFDKRVVALDLSRIVAGSGPEELQARLQKIVQEIVVAGNVILYIPDIHNLVKTSGTAYLSAADALIPMIKDAAFPVIGATSPRDFKQHVEPSTGFAAAFEVVRVEEIGEDDAQKVLVFESVLLERKSGLMITFGAIKSAVKLAKKYFRNSPLPGSATDLLKSALAAAERRGDKAVTHANVVEAAEARVNIPLHETGKSEAAELLNLEKTIHESMVGQDEAVGVVADSLREYRSGLARKGGPIASFLFVGPTGVGKTELAKTLAKIQFGSESLMVRFDMTEYQDKQSFHRFIGSPDGVVAGALTEAVQTHPYCLILLDEFEKAFPEILDLFLQVMDDGRLTDSLGRTVDFQNTIIIATSNAHSDIMNDALAHGGNVASVEDYLKKRLTDVFKPELLNRFSRVVVFRDLDLQQVGQIAAMQLRDFAASLAGQGMKISFSPEVAVEVAKLGYDPAFGARPLRRAIDEHLRAPLAKYILEKGLTHGAEIGVAFDGGSFVFNSGGASS
jgi:ATP-dependent Clp protease ATP-binding subunit ClpA